MPTLIDGSFGETSDRIREAWFCACNPGGQGLLRGPPLG